MTFELLQRIIDENNIPHDVTLRSNSGWECDATEMDGIWYHRQDNIIHFTQSGYPNTDEQINGFELLYGRCCISKVKPKDCKRTGCYCVIHRGEE